jgi:hypothetical protein
MKGATESTAMRVGRFRLGRLAIPAREVDAASKDGQLSGAHGVAQAHAEVAPQRRNVGRVILREQQSGRSLGHCRVRELERRDRFRGAGCAADHMYPARHEGAEQCIERLNAARKGAVEE